MAVQKTHEPCQAYRKGLTGSDTLRRSLRAVTQEARGWRREVRKRGGRNIRREEVGGQIAHQGRDRAKRRTQIAFVRAVRGSAMLMMTHAVIVMPHAMVVMRHRLMLGVMPDFLAMQDHFALHAGACDGQSIAAATAPRMGSSTASRTNSHVRMFLIKQEL